MADNNALDSASTYLFCNEETKALCFDDDDQLLQPFTHHTYPTKGKKDVIFSNGGSDSEPFISLPCLSEECIGYMLEREREHLPRHDYLSRLRNGELDIGLRREALHWMLKACAHFSFGETCLYSAISYFDRFLSIYELPPSLERGGKNWAFQLVAVACLSMAAKIEEVNVPSTFDLQAAVPKFLFEGKTIQRMEILVLSSLNWRIKAYTPCNFIDYYLRKMMNEEEFPFGAVISRSLGIISATIEGIKFLEFKPSEIAAAVAMYVSGEMQAMDIDKALLCLVGVEKGRVMKCLELIQDSSTSSMRGRISTSTTARTASNTVTTVNVANGLAPHSPIGVLEAACLSYKSDETTVGSCPSSSHSSPVTKRRKLDKTTTLGGDSSSHENM